MKSKVNHWVESHLTRRVDITRPSRLQLKFHAKWGQRNDHATFSTACAVFNPHKLKDSVEGAMSASVYVAVRDNFRAGDL